MLHCHKSLTKWKWRFPGCEHNATLSTILPLKQKYSLAVSISRSIAVARFQSTNGHCSLNDVVTVRQRSCGKVMFSLASVCHSVWWGWRGSHVIMTHDALDLTIQGPLLYRALPLLLVTSGRQDWRRVETCSLEESSPPVVTSGGSLLKHVRWESGWCASYWNAFSLLLLHKVKLNTESARINFINCNSWPFRWY